MGGRHVGLTVQLDKSGTTLAVRLCQSMPKATAAAATSSTLMAGSSTVQKDACSASESTNTTNTSNTTSATEVLLFLGTLPHAAAHVAAGFTAFAIVVWWLWGCVLGDGHAAQDGMMSAAGVLCGLAACVMWLRTLLFVFFQVHFPQSYPTPSPTLFFFKSPTPHPSPSPLTISLCPDLSPQYPCIPPNPQLPVIAYSKF
jgi:hypothetical protein